MADLADLEELSDLVVRRQFEIDGTGHLMHGRDRLGDLHRTRSVSIRLGKDFLGIGDARVLVVEETLRPRQHRRSTLL